MRVRLATESDRDVLRRLWEEFSAGGPPPPWVEDAARKAWRDIDDSVDQGLAFLFENGGQAVGFAFGLERSRRVVELTDVYVRPEVRKTGVATALIRAFVAAARDHGADVMTVTTGVRNEAARALYEGIGFRAESLNLVAKIEALERGLERMEGPRSHGSIHVQTDDLSAVERGVREFVPRLPGRSRGSVIVPPRNGWTSVYDELCDREPEMRRRLARELSSRMGAVVFALGIEEGVLVRYLLFDRGQVVDEYLSVPEHRGPLPPGDVIGLAANARVLARLTGADPGRIREAAPTARSPSELPPAADLVAGLADAIGLEGGRHGYEAALERPNAVKISRL